MVKKKKKVKPNKFNKFFMREGEENVFNRFQLYF